MVKTAKKSLAVKVTDYVKKTRAGPGDMTKTLVEAETTVAVKSYIASLRGSDRQPATITKYHNCLKAYAAWLRGEAVTEQSATEFLGSLRGQGFAPGTIKLYYHALKPFLANQGIQLRLKFNKRRHLPTYHSVDEVKRILAAAQKRSDAWRCLAGRDWLLLATLAYTGMRRSEVLSLKRSDIDFNNHTIRVHGKGDKDRVIPLSPVLFEPLFEHSNQLNNNDRLFPVKARRAWQIVINYARQAGVTGFHPHAFRHFFATQLIEQGISLHIIKELLGHADIATTAVYLDVLPKHLQAAISALPDMRG